MIRDALIAALQRHRDNDVFVHGEIYLSDDPQDTTEVRRMAITGVRYCHVTDSLIIDATQDIDRPAEASGSHGAGEAEGAGTPAAAGAAVAAGAPAQDPDAPPYASPFAYRAERGWRLT